VPFIVGCTQRSAKRAVVLGLLVTVAALAGYFYASNSFLEGVPFADAWPRTVAMVTSGYNVMWIVGGAITGPLYAYLGHRWRVARSWVGAALVTVALCFEPLARGAVGAAIAGGLTGSRSVWTAEALIGIAVGCAFLIAAGRARAASRAQPPQTPGGS
jgi:MFS family permease